MAILRVPQNFGSVSAAASVARTGDIIRVDRTYSTIESVTISTDGLTIDASAPARLNVTLATAVITLTLTGDANVAVQGGAGANFIRGNEGDNFLDGNAGRDRLNGGDGVDNLLGGLGNDRLNGGAGFDYADFENAAGAVRVNLATGRAFGADGTDTLRNIEAVEGSRFSDVLTGNNLDNALEGRRGNDRLNGGDGFDFAIYANATGAVTVNLATGRAARADGADTLRNIEAIEGSRFNDTLVGDNEANTLLGNRGNDRLDGGDGFDRASYFRAAGAVRVNLATGRAVGADGTDTLRNIEAVEGSRFSDVLTGNNLDNALEGRRGNDRLNGGDGFDFADYTNATGRVSVNLAAGTAAGADGNDTLRNIEGVQGSRFADTLIGDDRDNALDGNNGNDRLDGGVGADRMTGGRGNDTYVVDNIDENDTFVVDNTADEVIEEAGAGIDTVESTVSYQLGANLENLVLRGTAAISGSGNDLANQITGNVGDNFIDSGGRATTEGTVSTLPGPGDTLSGGLGNDTFDVVDAGPAEPATRIEQIYNSPGALSPELLRTFTWITDLNLGGDETAVDELNIFLNFDLIDVVRALPVDMTQFGTTFGQAFLNLVTGEGELNTNPEVTQKVGLYNWHGETFLIGEQFNLIGVADKLHNIVRVTGFTGILDQSDFGIILA